jgi:hypothetical protein
MKIVFAFITLFTITTCGAQVAINTTGALPHASAALDVQSSNKGFLPPRMSFDAIKAIVNPAPGLQVFDQTYKCVRYYDGSKWVKMAAEKIEPGQPLGETAVYGEKTGPNVFSTKICSDAAGNIYTVGRFLVTATFGSITLTAANNGMYNAFVAKYDKDGNALWARQFGNDAGEESLTGLTVVDGNVYVCGFFTSSTLTVGNTTLNNAGMAEIMLIKLDANGNVTWVVQANGVGDDAPTGLCADPAGNVYMSGYYTGASLSFTSFFTLNTSGSQDSYITKYNSSGVVQWAKNIGGNGLDRLLDLVYYDNGIAATGYFFSPSIALLNGVTLTNSGSACDAMVFKLNTSGQATWGRGLGAPNGEEKGTCITVGYDNCLNIGGTYETANALIGTTTLINKGSRDGMLIIITPTFTVSAWPLHSDNLDNITGIAYASNYIYISGNTNSITSFTSVNKTYPLINRENSQEGFVLRLLSYGVDVQYFAWFQQQGSVGTDNVSAITTDAAQENIYSTGLMGFDPGSLGTLTMSKGGYYIWRYNRNTL